jgi:WD40 repeat protein
MCTCANALHGTSRRIHELVFPKTSTIGKAFGKLLDEQFVQSKMAYREAPHSPPTTSRSMIATRSRSPSPASRALALIEAERQAAATEKGVAAERQVFCTVPLSHMLRSIVVGPEGHIVYTAGKDGLVRIWDLEYVLSKQGAETPPQPCTAVLHGHASGVACLCIVDKRYICSGGWNAEVRVWDMHADHACVATLRGHVEFVRAVAGADGLLFSGSNDRTIKVWDLESRECVGMMAGHSLAVVCLAVADGRLYSGGYDFKICVWDIPSRQCIGELGGHTQVITGLFVTARAAAAEDQARANKNRRSSTAGASTTQAYTLYSCSEDMTVSVLFECLVCFFLAVEDQDFLAC